MHEIRGIISYKEFTQAGFDVHIFERDNVPGGNWHYTEETSDRPPVPNAEASIGDFAPSLPPEDAVLPYEEHYNGSRSKNMLRAHRAPKPVWATLHSNTPAVGSPIPVPPFTANFRSVQPIQQVSQIMYVRSLNVR